MGITLLIAAYAILVSLRYFFNIIFTIIFIKKKTSDFKKENVVRTVNSKKKLFLLIPVYKEADIISDTIKFYQNNILKNTDVSVFLITTNKEGIISENRTYIVASNSITNKRIKILHTKTRLGKGAQLNEAISIILKKTRDMEKVYLGIFDVDSRPSDSGLDYILRDKSNPELYQMGVLYYNNNPKNVLANANAIFQTRWTFCYEFPIIISNYTQRKIVNLAYCLGHGLFIRGDYAFHNKFSISTQTEDLAFGYYASFNNIFVKPVPFFDYCSVPNNLKDNIKQSARWFAGELVFYQEFIKTNFKSRLIKMYFCLLMIKRYFILMHWIMGPPIYLFIVFYSFYMAKNLMFYLIGLFVLTYIIFPYLLIKFFLRSKCKRWYNDLTWLMIKSAINWIGPGYAIYRLLIQKMKIKRYDFFKTPK